MSYSIEHIAEVTNARLSAYDKTSIVEHLLTDSRKIIFPATSLFFALKSTLRDGHVYTQDLYERGIRNFCVHPAFEYANYKDANFIIVENTLQALQRLAAYHRRQFTYPVIGITGSNGKTIVKEWLNQLLSPDYNIVRSPRSYNSQIGVPLSVWNMNNQHTLAILEAGISMPGEMEKLQKIIQPTIGVFTNIGDAHSEGFESLQQKANEKAILFTSAKEIVFNADDEVIKQAISSVGNNHTSITWGHGDDAIFKIKSVIKTPQSTSIEIEVSAEHSPFTIHHLPLTHSSLLTIPFTDDASIANAITCFTVCAALGLSYDVIAPRMLLLQPVEMRLQLLPAINNCAVINDSYSFDLNSFHIALDFLLQQNQYIQHTIILSDLPQGDSDGQYQQAAELLKNKEVQRVITIGRKWKERKILFDDSNIRVEDYDGMEDFMHRFNTNHFKNEVILLKGARVYEFEKLVHLFDRKVHQTSMEINLTAIAHNLKEYRQQLNPGTKLMAMVKAYGYGSGSAEVANVLQFHKVDYLAVAYADEGIELRKAGISLPVMILNVDEAAFEAVVEYNLEPEIYSFEILQSFLSFIKQQALQLYPVHIKIDTGMHRLGFEEKDMDALLDILISNSSFITIKSVLSHLAASEDENEDAFTQQQLAIYKRCASGIESIVGYSFIKHIANTAAIFRHHNAQLDMVRLGIGLYGVDSAPEHQLHLQTVATLKTTVAQLRNVKAGDTIGYNRRGKVTRDSLIATIRIGYADGFIRRLGNGNGSVFIKGGLYPVIGSVCMDMTMIDVTGIGEIKVGDEVEIFGKNLPIEKVAAWGGTIAYEILTGINQRVKRIYVEE